MKKSFRPSRPSRPIHRPSISRPMKTGGSHIRESFSRPKESHGSGGIFNQSPGKASGGINPSADSLGKEGGGASKEFFGGTPGGYQKESFGVPRRRWGRRSTPLITLVVIFICCLILICLAVVYAISQNMIDISSIF